MTDLHVARVELVLARPDHEPLRDVPLRPDPLGGFAQVFEQLRPGRGEAATVAIDLLPASANQRRRWRSRLRAANQSANTRRVGRRSSSGAAGIGQQMLENRGVGPGVVASAGGLAGGDRQDLQARRDVQAKLRRDALLGLQILVRVTSQDAGRAELLVDGLVSCFDVFSEENYFRASGLHLGVAFIGSDAPLRAWWFDRRLTNGLFRPARRSLVSAREIAGLLKPPTQYCQARNVARSGALIAPAPRDMPRYRRQPGVLPLGLVRSLDGERLIGMARDEFFFGYVAGRSRFGKALAIDTSIPTPDGWTTMGELEEGDRVFDERGQACNVVAATPVMHEHECFEVVFSDGQRIVADAEHRWLTHDLAGRRAAACRAERPARGRPRTSEHPSRFLGVSWSKVAKKWAVQVAPHGYMGYFADEQEAGRVAAAAFSRRPPSIALPRVVTTRQIAATLRTASGHANHAILTCEPLQYPAARLPVDPYVLGAWLGDGNTADSGITCASVDDEILEKIRRAGYELIRWCPSDVTRAPVWGIRGLHGPLRRLGVLGAKHIPAEYQRASAAQRVELLCGLMDTDGSIAAAAANCEFSVTNRRLAEDVLELLLGLGVKAVWTTARARIDGRDVGERYRINFTPTFPVFSLRRKRVRQRLERQHPSRRLRYIVDVRAVPSVPVRCIAVDSPSHLYLAGRGCIPTHNTEVALEQAVHVAAVAKEGLAFFDPHSDALERMRPYLTGEGVRERVIELDFSRRDPDGRHVAWNLLSMEGYGIGDLADRAQGVVDSFTVAAGWGKNTGRATTIIGQAATSLLHLSLLLEPELAPTIFTIPRLLGDEHWREIVVSALPDDLQRYWADVYSTYSSDAIGPVANMITRLGRHPVIRATLGSPRSTYNARRAMDENRIVLACPGGGREALLANFIVQDWIQAARSRRDMPPDRRRLFSIFLDELQSFDAAASAAGGSSVAELLEQCGKYGVRVLGLSQSPHRLTESTIDAIATNSSIMGTLANSAEASAFFDRQWAGLLDAKTAIPRLGRFTYILQPTHNGKRTEPFQVHGVPIEELYSDLRHPEALPELEHAVDEAVRPRTVRQSLAAIEGHDDRILEELARRTSRRRAQRPLRAVEDPLLEPVRAEYGLIVEGGAS